MAGDVLVADEVHSVAEAGYKADVGDGVQGGHLVWFEGGVEEVHWDVADSAWEGVSLKFLESREPCCSCLHRCNSV